MNLEGDGRLDTRDGVQPCPPCQTVAPSDHHSASRALPAIETTHARFCPRAAPNGARPMRSTAHNCNLGESSGTTATHSGTLSIPWTQVGSEIIDPTHDVSLHLPQATGIGGYGVAQI